MWDQCDYRAETEDNLKAHVESKHEDVKYHVRSAISNTLMHLISDNIYSQFMKVRIMLAINVIIKQHI